MCSIFLKETCLKLYGCPYRGQTTPVQTSDFMFSKVVSNGYWTGTCLYWILQIKNALSWLVIFCYYSDCIPQGDIKSYLAKVCSSYQIEIKQCLPTSRSNLFTSTKECDLNKEIMRNSIITITFRNGQRENFLRLSRKIMSQPTV